MYLTTGVQALAVLVPFVALRLVACRCTCSRETLPVLVPIRTHKMRARVACCLGALAVFVPFDARRKITYVGANRAGDGGQNQSR